MTEMSEAKEKTETKEAEIPVSEDARVRITKEAVRIIREENSTMITTKNALKILHLQ